MITSEFEQINIVSLQPILLRFAMCLTSNNDDALDLLQDTNLKVLENIDRFIPETNFKSWVFKIMRNIFLNQCQHARHPLSRTEMIDSDNVSIISRADTQMSPLQFCETLEINKAIDNLRPDFRTSFTLLISGFRYKEISKLTGYPETIVKNNIALARRSLHSSLAAYRV